VGQEFFFKISEIGPSLFGLRSHCKGGGERKGRGSGVEGRGGGGTVLGVRCWGPEDCRFSIADCDVSPEFPVGRPAFFGIFAFGP